jgi:hypothetical protein
MTAENPADVTEMFRNPKIASELNDPLNPTCRELSPALAGSRDQTRGRATAG